MYDLLVIGGVLAAAWQGSQMGVRAASLLAAEFLAAVTAGVLLHESLAAAIASGTRMAAEPFLPLDFPYQAVGVSVAFLLVTWGSFVALRFWLHADEPTAADLAERENRATIEKVAGGLVGGCAGVMLVGAALISLSMLPLPKILRPRPQAMFLDAGTMVLRMAGGFQPDHHDGVSLIVYGEPASRASDAAAKLTSEPNVPADVEDEARPSPEPSYSDVDGNGNFTKDLYFSDLDGDNARRIGLRDKYVLGSWGGGLTSYARDRPTPGQSGIAPQRQPDDPDASPPPVQPSPPPEGDEPARPVQSTPEQTRPKEKPPTGKPKSPDPSKPETEEPVTDF